MEIFSRSEILLGIDSTEKLRASKVIVFGLGGVGGYAVEALARAGVGTIAVVDSDKIAKSNINRQILATSKTVGRAKTDLAAERIALINPEITVIKYPLFYLAETANEISLNQFDYIIDAIDTVSAKVELAARAFNAGVPIISSMGTGNKLDPTAFRVSDIYSTSVCPLAKTMRSLLKKRGIASLKTVYSTEPPLIGNQQSAAANKKDTPIGSVSFVPPVAGFILAGEVIKHLIK